MRIAKLSILPLLGALALVPNRSQAQISIQLGAQARAREVRVYGYSRDQDGDWRTNYRRWQPVTLYTLDGRYYDRAVRGARAIQVYSYNNQYFLPPQDAEWNNFDSRYQYGSRPRDDDYNTVDRVVNVYGGRAPYSWGREIVVNTYSPDAYGDWRSMWRRWTPVTVYTRDGRYFSRQVRDSRPVQIYTYNNQYFLPPQDAGWNNADRRYNYRRRPGDDDYRNADRIRGVYGDRDRSAAEPAYGEPVDLMLYSPDVHGDWRSASNRWEVTTVYYQNGRYYRDRIPGARELMLYRWQNQYFLPPREQGWESSDRRFDNRMRPTDEDYNNAQRPRRP